MSSESRSSGDEKISTFEGEMVQHGTGVNSRRAFPTINYPSSLDPFVLFERFYIDADKGFPMHPHKGFEIISYMIEGGMEHEDSLNVKHTAYEDTAMRITTGGGIKHSEFPADDNSCNGLQLWVNLPRDKKDIDADYQDAEHSEMKTVKEEDAEVTTVVGEGSPIEVHTEMEYLDVKLNGEWTWNVKDGFSGFIFGVAGEGKVKDEKFGKGDVLTVKQEEQIQVESSENFRFIAVQGKPHNQPIRQKGPYVF